MCPSKPDFDITHCVGRWVGSLRATEYDLMPGTRIALVLETLASIDPDVAFRYSLS